MQKRISSLPQLYESAQYSELLQTYESLQAENIDFRDAQIMQVLAAKAHLQLGQDAQALPLLQEASNEMRTASGSEAKYLLAQYAFDHNQVDKASNIDNELIQSGTPHQYWLARGIILMSDILRSQGEVFTADEYLKSLKLNYTAEDDIQIYINDRLRASEEAAAAHDSSTTTGVTNELENEK